MRVVILYVNMRVVILDVNIRVVILYVNMRVKKFVKRIEEIFTLLYVEVPNV